MNNVRWSEDGWQMRCPDCPARVSPRWWPLTEEFWDRRNLARCRACNRELKRARDRASERRRDYIRSWRREAVHAIALYNRDYYEANKDRILAQVADYAERNRERIAAKRRERYLRKREELLAQKRAHYEANRESILAQRRAAYAAKKAA